MEGTEAPLDDIYMTSAYAEGCGVTTHLMTDYTITGIRAETSGDSLPDISDPPIEVYYVNDAGVRTNIPVGGVSLTSG